MKAFSGNSRLASLALLLLLAGAVSGCGQTGPLILPSDAAETADSANEEADDDESGDER